MNSFKYVLHHVWGTFRHRSHTYKMHSAHMSGYVISENVYATIEKVYATTCTRHSYNGVTLYDNRSSLESIEHVSFIHTTISNIL
jgi:hypothetical protein